MGMGHNEGGRTFILEANVKARVQKAATKLSDLLAVLMTGLVQDSEAISDEIFDTIDRNKDQKVSKQEFSKNFGDAFGAVVDFTKITREILKQRPQQSSSSLPVENAVSCGLICLAVASAAFI